MISRLLPRRSQVATLRTFSHTGGGSNLTLVSSRTVAGWVASWVENISLTYRVEEVIGSRCSTFFNNLRIKVGRGGKERIGVTIGISCYTCYPGMQPGPPNVVGPS